MTRIKTDVETARDWNEVFILLPVEAQALIIRIAKEKRGPWYLPKWAIDAGIDQNDKREVRMYKAIAYHQRYPYLRNEPERPQDQASGQTILLSRYRALRGWTVYGIDRSDEPVVGYISLTQEFYDQDGDDLTKTEVERIKWVELIDQKDRVWKIIE